MGNGKRKAPSPAESTRLAPSRLTTPVHQASSRCDMPNQGDIAHQHTQDHLASDSSSELEYQEEDQWIPPTLTTAKSQELTQAYSLLRASPVFKDLSLYHVLRLGLEELVTNYPAPLVPLLKENPVVKKLTTKAAPRLLHEATPPPLAASTPRAKPAPVRNPPATRASKHTPPPPPSQPAPKLTYAAALGSKAPCPRKAHPPTKLVAPASTKWVVIPTDKSLLRDPAKRPSPLHVVSAINHELSACADEYIRGVHIANLGDSHILAATWTVGCNILLTATKTRDHHGLANPAYSTIVANALATIPAFSSQGTTVDPSANRPIELTSVYQTLDDLGIFKGVELIKNGPAPSDALSWARDPKTFNAESRPCAVTVWFYNNDGWETGSLLKKAFYLLGRRCRFNK
ncbi:hypothetical protein H0H81_000710 [Sphagnurus paluster]|uniref:Uncharacterized protein n=1 Tax=Sphagnurus paluster TaxID=117069 RepID=A0A9P7GND3_9AGAR|nr:hypothetical protein H0H81_000710 [Sphagnurus paluster]